MAASMPEAATEGNIRPTKLFIGGISRRTTTKQLRDHFSVCGRVLDCVAMRQPDGRPRGFGYVTLDSPAAAEFFLREPQMIDDRYVDLKPAVPDANAGNKNSGMPSPTGSMAGKAGLTQQCYDQWSNDMNMNMAMNMYGMDASYWMEQQALAAGCMGLLSHQRQAPPALPARFPPASLPPLGPVPPLAPSSAPEFTPSAIDCVSLLTTTPVTSPTAAAAPPRAKAVLSEVTNIMTDRATNKDAVKQPSYLSVAVAEAGEKKAEALSLRSFQPKHGMAPPPLDEDFFVMPDDDIENVAPNTSTSSANPLSTEPGSSNVSEVSSPQMCPASPTSAEPLDENGEPINTENLPSAGSALHSIGECRRCNFFAKGRCRNGQDCTFCHFSHDRRKLTRQEKRDAQAARALAQQHMDQGVTAPPPSPTASEAANNTPPKEQFGAAMRLPPGLFLDEQDDSVPTAVPTPVPTPMGVCPPPGLGCPPGLLSPSAGGAMLSTSPCGMSAAAAAYHMAMPRAAPGALLSTSPPCPPPQTAAPAVMAAAKEAPVMCTMGTQTDEELSCPRCGGKA